MVLNQDNTIPDLKSIPSIRFSTFVAVAVAVVVVAVAVAGAVGVVVVVVVCCCCCCCCCFCCCCCCNVKSGVLFLGRVYQMSCFFFPVNIRCKSLTKPQESWCFGRSELVGGCPWE